MVMFAIRTRESGRTEITAGLTLTPRLPTPTALVLSFITPQRGSSAEAWRHYHSLGMPTQPVAIASAVGPSGCIVDRIGLNTISTDDTSAYR